MAPLSLREMLLTLLREFQELSSRIPPNPLDPNTEGHRIIAALSHVKALLLELERPSERRYNGPIRSSWALVRDFGVRYGLFKAYAGDEALRAELKAFLGSGVPPITKPPLQSP